MPLIALTGGIASGKSTVAARLAEHGAVIVDADEVVRDLQRPGGSVLARIAERFGPGMLRDDGELDRQALARAVFGDDAATAALNAIVHPAVQRRSQELFAQAFARDARSVVVYDVPLLVEAGTHAAWDLIVTVEAPEDERIRRLVTVRGMDEADARARVRSQASSEQRRALADVVIDSSRSLAHTRRQADRLWERVSAPGTDVGGRP